MQFELIEKTYKSEKYISHIKNEVYALVEMYYHTYLKYWDVRYSFTYNKNYITPPIYSYEAINIKNGRKTVRKIAFEFMEKASFTDYNKLSEFHRKIIKEELK